MSCQVVLEFVGRGESIFDCCQQIAVDGQADQTAKRICISGRKPALELVLAAPEDALDSGTEIMATDGEATFLGDADGAPHGAVLVSDICQDQRLSLWLLLTHRVQCAACLRHSVGTDAGRGSLNLQSRASIAERLTSVPRKILVKGSTEDFDLVEVEASNELELQELLRKNPQLIPAEDLGLAGDLLVVGRETRVASGAIDLLCLSKTGELVIVEFKTGPKNTDFRHVLAQLIDYGSDIWKLGDWCTFDEGVVHRYLTSQYVEPRFVSCADLHDAAVLAWALSQDEWDALTVRLDQVIKKGDFHFVVAAQRFVEPMKVSVSYLNATAHAGRYFLMEVIRLDGGGQTAYAAQIVHKPERLGGSASPTGKTDEDEFLARISDPEYHGAMSELFSSVQALGLTMEWGSKGASIRLKSPDRPEPISVGWVFLDGDQWTFAKHVTFGVDSNTLQNHPTIGSAILDFCQKVKAVPGAKPAGGKSNAAIFEPPHFVAVRDKLIQLVGDLSATINS
jgi:hypothetical protein